jgi:hypothetical protein
MSSSNTVSWRGTSSAPAPVPAPRRGSLERWLFLLGLAVYLFLGSGGIASSDGTTMFTLAESLTHGRLDIPAGNGKVGRDGRLYAKADPGQAIVAVPLVVLGRATAPLLPDGPFRRYWPKAVASALNAFVGALVLLVLHRIARSLGYSPRTALLVTLGLGFTTSFLPYTKSFMREPLLALCLLASFLSLRRHAREQTHVHEPAGRGPALPAHPLRAGLWLGAGLVVKSTLGLNLPILAAYLFVTTLAGGRKKALLAFAIGPTIGLALIALYNAARFGSPWTSGYDPTVDNFSTPLFVGLYGQLLSSGKSIFLYAPLGLAALWGISGLARHHRAEAVTALGIFIVNVVFHARFASWAGEGSWGPRYLVPFLPFLVLPAAELWQSSRPWRRRAFAAALILGALVQIGGTAIYFGSYLRDIGEYPYQREFSDPLFLVRSHFVPNDTPVVGHWRLLVRNAGLLANAETRPRIALAPPADPTARLPIAAEDVDELRYVIDLWFCYLIYAGLAPRLVLVLVVGAMAVVAVTALRLRSALTLER